MEEFDLEELIGKEVNAVVAGVRGQAGGTFSRIITFLPVEDIEGPARRRLQASQVAWWWYVLIGIVLCAIAWVSGSR